MCGLINSLNDATTAAPDRSAAAADAGVAAANASAAATAEWRLQFSIAACVYPVCLGSHPIINITDFGNYFYLVEVVSWFIKR